MKAMLLSVISILLVDHAFADVKCKWTTFGANEEGQFIYDGINPVTYGIESPKAEAVIRPGAVILNGIQKKTTISQTKYLDEPPFSIVLETEFLENEGDSPLIYNQVWFNTRCEREGAPPTPAIDFLYECRWHDGSLFWFHKSEQEVEKLDSTGTVLATVGYAKSVGHVYLRLSHEENLAEEIDLPWSISGKYLAGTQYISTTATVNDSRHNVTCSRLR